MAKKPLGVWVSSILLVVTAAAVLLGLLRLSRPDPELTPLYLGYTADEPNGWSFETEDGFAEPHIGFGGYFEGIAADTAGAVVAERIMEEPGMRDLLEFGYFGVGIQVFLDGELLYTDFAGMDNRADALLEVGDTSTIEQGTLHIALPYDCAGKILRVVTYGESWDGYRSVIFPSLTSRFSDAAVMSASTVPELAAATALALLALFLLLMFLLGVLDGEHRWSLLPLAAYFLLATVPLLLKSFAADAAGLSRSHPLSAWISFVYIDFLAAFVALELKRTRRWILLGAAALHMLLSLARVVWGVFLPDRSDAAGLVLLVLTAAMMFSAWKERALFRRGAVCIGAAAAVMFAAWGASRFIESALLYPVANPANALLAGDPRAFYGVLSAVAAAVCSVSIVAEFVRDALERRRVEQTLRLRDGMARESYEQALESINRTASMRHEWKNQIAALHLLWQQGDTEGLGERLRELDDRLDKLAPRRYSEHFAINAILQNAAARAETLGIAFRAEAPVPAELGISDGDLTSLLLNLLDNALEGAARVPDADKREVECVIKVRQSHLAISCENTYAGALRVDESGQLLSTKDGDGHGFGLVQMRGIAEKYGSVFDVSYTDDRFTVRTALKLG